MKDLTKIKEFLQSVGADLSKLDSEGKYHDSLSIHDNSSLTSVTFPEGMAIGGDLYISYNSSLTSVTFPEGMAIGGFLYIRENSSLTSVTFPEGMAIGGNLYIRENSSLTSVTFPEGMAIGGDLYIHDNSSMTSVHNSVAENVLDGYIWDHRGVRYIKADDIFTKLLSYRGNVYKVARIGRNEESYLVTNGAGKWAHGETLQEAREDLLYKISDRDTSRYKGLTLESELTHEEAIEAYRVITGACSAGTRHFCESILPKEEVREEYTVAKIIELTAGNYGSEKFREFFTR